MDISTIFHNSKDDDIEFKKFRIGSCEGLWGCSDKEYIILAVINNTPGNGHFQDVLDWFRQSCVRDKKNLKISEVWNKRLLNHLITKKRFTKLPLGDNVIQSFKQMNK
jgi:hypothetical protein